MDSRAALLSALANLKIKGKIKSEGDVARDLGYTKSSFSRIKNSGMLSKNFIKRFEAKYKEQIYAAPHGLELKIDALLKDVAKIKSLLLKERKVSQRVSRPLKKPKSAKK